MKENKLISLIKAFLFVLVLDALCFPLPMLYRECRTYLGEIAIILAFFALLIVAGIAYFLLKRKTPYSVIYTVATFALQLGALHIMASAWEAIYRTHPLAFLMGIEYGLELWCLVAFSILLLFVDFISMLVRLALREKRRNEIFREEEIATKKRKMAAFIKPTAFVLTLDALCFPIPMLIHEYGKGALFAISFFALLLTAGIGYFHLKKNTPYPILYTAIAGSVQCVALPIMLNAWNAVLMSYAPAFLNGSEHWLVFLCLVTFSGILLFIDLTAMIRQVVAKEKRRAQLPPMEE